MRPLISIHNVPLHGVPMSFITRVNSIVKDLDGAFEEMTDHEHSQSHQNIHRHHDSTRRLDEYYAYAFAEEDSHYAYQQQQQRHQVPQHPLMQTLLLVILGVLVVASVAVFVVQCRRHYKGQPKLVLHECDCGKNDDSIGRGGSSTKLDIGATGKALNLLNDYHSGSAAGVATQNTTTAMWRTGVTDGSSPMHYRRPSSPGTVPAQSYVTMA